MLLPCSLSRFCFSGLTACGVGCVSACGMRRGLRGVRPALCLALASRITFRALFLRLCAAHAPLRFPPRPRDTTQQQHNQSEARDYARKHNITLLPSATSPLPPAADRPVWRHYNVSFLILYFNKSRRRAFTDTKEFIKRLHDCTHGNRGDGELGPGFTSEVIVNVDSRGEGTEWDEVVERYGGRGQGSFVTVLLSDNYHEARARACSILFDYAHRAFARVMRVARFRSHRLRLLTLSPLSNADLS